MNRVLIASAVMALVAAAFVHGVSQALPLPTICGFLAWTPAVWFVGWTMAGAARGRKIRISYTPPPVEPLQQMRRSDEVRQARQREPGDRRQQRLQQPERVDYDENNPLEAVRRGALPQWQDRE